MSVYSHLLRTAVDRGDSGQGSTTGDVLAQLLDRRSHLGATRSSYTGSDWAPTAIADQLAYDVALVELCRRLGIEVDLTRFGRPEHERVRLEQALVSRGIRLEELAASTEFSDQPHRARGRR